MALPDHAQRMRSLFASDRLSVPSNIHCMFVTLEMSKLSGWLNTDA